MLITFARRAGFNAGGEKEAARLDSARPFSAKEVSLRKIVLLCESLDALFQISDEYNC